MADIKISQLGAATGVTATDLFPMINDGATSTTKATAALLKLFTTGDITALSTSDKSSVVAAINEIVTADSKRTLFFTSVACSATTGNFASVSDAKITSSHVLVECVFANPAAITTDVTWTTSSGSLVLNGTCASATTATITLAKKDN